MQHVIPLLAPPQFLSLGLRLFHILVLVTEEPQHQCIMLYVVPMLKLPCHLIDW